MDMLGRLIRDARSHKGLTQEALARLLSTSRTTIQYVEGGYRNGSLEMLESIHRALSPDEPITAWVLASLERAVATREGLGEESKSALKTDLQAAIEALMPNAGDGGQLQRSLATFPKGFEPITVVLGDRREDPPISRGDLLVGSASTEDARYLLSLGLADQRSVLRTDKIIVNTSNRDDLIRVFGNTNLLVIGSPFVNFAARVVNMSSAFRFEPLQTLRAWLDNLDSITAVEGSELAAFATMSSERVEVDTEEGPISEQRRVELQALVERLWRDGSAETLREAYRPSGLIDPIQNVRHPANRGSSVSYGLVSLAPNPFDTSGDHVAITVAGVHLPGTAMALRALAEGDFEHHPFGGIIQVVHLTGSTQDAWWSWATRRYSAADLVGALESAHQSSTRRRGAAFTDWTQDEIAESLVAYRLLSESCNSRS